MCQRRSRATTFYGHMRGPTLLLHQLLVKPLIHTRPTPKRPSPVLDDRPLTIYRLAAIVNRLLFSIIAGLAIDLNSSGTLRMACPCGSRQARPRRYPYGRRRVPCLECRLDTIARLGRAP